MLPVAPTQRALVVAGGLPGAGKTTLLRGLTGVPVLRMLDPEQVADPLMRRLVVIPYGVLRPLVHAVHWLRVTAALLRHDGTVIVHETATRATARTALAILARVTRRAAHLVWLDVDPATARHAQRARRRVLSPARFARHVRRARNMDLPALRGWDSITILRLDGRDTGRIRHLVICRLAEEGLTDGGTGLVHRPPTPRRAVARRGAVFHE